MNLVFRKIINNLNGNSPLIHNFSWAMLARVISLGGSLVTGVLIARFLGTESFGEYSFILSYVLVFITFSSFGLDNIELVEFSKKNYNDFEICSNSLFIRSIFVVISFVVLWISLCFYKLESNTFWYLILYSSSLLTTPFNVYKNYFIGNFNNKIVAKSEIIRTLIVSSCKISFVFFKLSFGFFIIASILDLLVLSLGYASMFYSTKRFLFSMSYLQYDIIVDIVKKAFPLFLSGSVLIIYQRIDNFIIFSNYPKSSVGIYSVAQRLVDISIFIPITYTQVIVPRLVSVRNISNSQYITTSIKYLRVLVWLSIVFIAFYVLLGKFAILLLFGDKYVESYRVLVFLSFNTFTMAMFYFSGQMMVIQGVHKYSVIRNIVGLIVFSLLSSFVIRFLNYEFIALVNVISFFISGFMFHYLLPQFRNIFYVQVKALQFYKLLN